MPCKESVLDSRWLVGKFWRWLGNSGLSWIDSKGVLESRMKIGNWLDLNENRDIRCVFPCGRGL